MTGETEGFMTMLGYGYILVFLIYFIPSFIAILRNHHYKYVIIGINAASGFTVIGWVISFIWAVWPNNTTIFGVNPTSQEFYTNNNLEILHNLDNLRKEGIISDEEFNEKKKSILRNY